MEAEAAATARAPRRAREASAWAERYAERAGDAVRRPRDRPAFSDSSDAGRAGRPRSTGHRRTARPAADRGTLALSPAERREAGEVPSETRRRRTGGLGSRRSRHDRGRAGRPRSTTPEFRGSPGRAHPIDQAHAARGSTTRLRPTFATRPAAPPATASRCRSSPAAAARRDAPPRRRSLRPPN